MWQRLKQHWLHYLWQSALGAIAIFALLLLLNMQEGIIVSSFGATTFIMFMKPSSPFASPRNVIGAHLIGVLAGALFTLIPHNHAVTEAALYAGSVGLSLLLMAASDLEHPPAAGTALSVVMGGFTWPLVLTVLTCTIVLSLLHQLLRKWLIDL